MARAFQVMGAGFSPGQAVALGGTINNAVSAAGTTQGTATTLTSAINNVTTVAANAGVILPQGQPGDRFFVFNGGANALTIYPPTSAKINGLATNGGVAIGLNTGIELVQISTTLFFANLSA